MQQLKRKNPLYLESSSGEKYTNPFFLFSRVEAPVRKKALYGKFCVTYYRIGARYYDADIGQWISPDAAREFHDLYSYTGGNPINRIDPDGRCTECDYWANVMGFSFAADANEKQGEVGKIIVVSGIQALEDVNNVVGTAATLLAIVDPEPATKASAMTVAGMSSNVGVALDALQVAIDPSLENVNDLAMDVAFMPIGKKKAGFLAKIFGYFKPTKRNKNAFWMVKKNGGHFGSKEKGSMGQSLDAASNIGLNQLKSKLNPNNNN